MGTTMTIHHFRHSLLGACLTAALLLHGCAMPIAPDDADSVTASSTDKKPANTPGKNRSSPAKGKASTSSKAGEPSITQANQLLKKGDKAAAADMYYRSAFGYPSPQRERIILQAAEITASTGDDRTTASYLKRVPQSALQGESRERYQYIQALLALQNKQANQALGLLPNDLNSLPAGLRDKVLLVRKRAIEMGGTVSASATRNSSPAAAAATTAAVQQPPAVQARPAPAQKLLPASSNKLAVLLPQSGALTTVSKEIFQGIRDAQRPYGDQASARLYDVNPANALAQYQQAVAEGADMVIGPLDKDSLAALLSNPAALTTPILSLNYDNDRPSPAALYQFGLSPEDEARQIAEFTVNRGQRQAIVMVPNSSWGKRLADTFVQTYQARGGKVLMMVNYPNSDSSSYLKQVQGALNSAEGAQMVFLGASPTQARLIRPLLQDQAGLLPVYATSHIFSGRLEKDKDTDLDGIIYTEVPLILQGINNGSLDTLKFPRLYALGADAVLIANNLAGLSRQQTLPGKTGQISLLNDHSIQRRLDFATFINGVPNSLGN